MRTRCTRLLSLSAIALLMAPYARGATAPSSFPSLYWKTDKRIAKVKAVFTSPIEPALAFLVAVDGLHRTEDNGANWALVPGTDPKKMGEISCVAVCPARPKFVALGTKGRGVFLSHDGGKTWKPAGGTRSGLACSSVHSLTFTVEDRGWDTLFACHDTAGTGLSISVDGGKTWRINNPSRFFRSIVSCGRIMVASSAAEAHPDEWALMRSDNYGEAWHPVQRSVIPTYGARNQQRHPRLLWGSLTGELFCSFNWGDGYFPVGPESGGKWASVFATPGPNAKMEWMWAYDPVRYGLLCARVGSMRERWKPNNRGLYVDRMTKRGANITANAIGTRFYACINGYLIVGKHVRKRNMPSIPRCEAVPLITHIDMPVRTRMHGERTWILARQRALGGGVRGRTRSKLVAICTEISKAKSSREYVPKICQAIKDGEAAKQKRRIGVRVWVEHTKGPKAIKQVTVTPDALGLGPVKLFDDGKHNDLKPGDGVWGGHFLYTEPNIFRNYHKKDPRHPFPGNIPVPVEAEDTEGNKATWSVIIGLHFKPVPYTFWSGTQKWGRNWKEGDIELSSTPEAAPNGKDPTLVFTGKAGPWFAWHGDLEGQHNLTGFKHITFKFKGKSGSGDIGFFLLDGLTTNRKGDIGALEPNFHSATVPLLKRKYLRAMDGKFHTVKIPVTEFARSVRFLRGYVAGFGLRAPKGFKGGTYTIDEVRFEH